jgi:signal transduction histidine kinase
MLIIHFKVTDRVLKVQTVLDKWSNGDRNAIIELKGNDELNHIATMINHLVSRFSEDEKALIFNKQVNDAIIQSANYSIITTDKNGIINSFNTSAERLLAIPKKSLSIKNLPESSTIFQRSFLTIKNYLLS